MYSNIIKAKYDKPTSNIKFNGEMLKPFLLRSETRQEFSFLPLVVKSTRSPIQSYWARKRNKRHPTWRGRSKTVLIFIWYDAIYVNAKSPQSWPTLCDSMDCSPSGSSVYGILQARILEWVAMPSSISHSGIKLMSLTSPALPLAPSGKPLQIYYKHIIIKIVHCWHKKRHINATGSRNKPLYIHGQLIFDKGAKNIQWGKYLFSKAAGKTGNHYADEISVPSSLLQRYSQ